MENTESIEQGGITKTALTYGLLIGVLLIVLQLVFYLAGGLTSKIQGWISYAVLLGGIILATKAYRDEVRGGFLSYGQALGFGTLTIFFSALLMGIYIFVFYKFIAPGAINLLIEANEAQLIKRMPQLSDAEIDTALAFSQRFMKPGFLAGSIVFNYTFLGFVMALITSIFMKKKNPEEF